MAMANTLACYETARVLSGKRLIVQVHGVKVIKLFATLKAYFLKILTDFMLAGV
jgi:hypothetical protein